MQIFLVERIEGPCWIDPSRNEAEKSIQNSPRECDLVDRIEVLSKLGKMHEMEVVIIRQLLEQLLDYHYEAYLGKLRDWFNQKITKEQFDNDLSSILQGEILQLHNQLLMAILAQSASLSEVAAPGSSLTNVPKRASIEEELENVPAAGQDELILFKALKNKNSAVPFSVYNVDCKRALDYHADSSRRFPMSFVQQFSAAFQGTKGGSDKVNVIPNVTHGIIADEEKVRNNPLYLKALQIKPDPDQPLLTSEANLYGRFLVEAWKRQVEDVDAEAVNCAVQAALHHIKNVLIAIAKQRKSFRVREGRCYVHSIGAPYPNPYLLQGHQIFEETYSSDTAKLADVMQIPSFLPTHEERERLAALEVAASAPLKYPHKPHSKATLTDLHDAIKADRSLIPNYNHRTKICEIIFQRARGYGDAYSSDDAEFSADFDSKTELPIVSY